MNSISKLALVFIVVGAVVLAGPTFGFSTIAADRGTSVTVADDTSAYLGVFDNSPNQSADVSSKSDGEVFYLDDNVDSYDLADVDAEVISFNGGQTSLVGQVDTADNSHDFTALVSCGTSDRKESGNVTVRMTASGNPSIDLERTTSESISVDCKGKGSGNFEVEDASTGKTNSTAVLTLNNTGAQVNLKEISIDDTSANADRVNNGTDPEIVVGSKSVNERNDAIYIDGSQHRINQNVNNGQTVTVTMGEFTDGNKMIYLEGETVTITLYDNNGALQTIQATITSG